MTLSPGTKLGVYEIAEPIGKGGMGEVYRARDTKLGRDVAIKVLPEELSRDGERLARFEREAKLLAGLNHPSIATLYGFEDSGGVSYLAMELVPGATLAERIASGPITVDDAIAIARQVADALEAAHEAGVIHRDLKPANVKLTDDGQVKVLDFGLAKAFAGEGAEVDSSLSPTLTREGTQTGVVLGTAAYMSPEQARGRSVDKRADVFAFGCVLYEMLTGRRAFDGETVSDILASVIKTDPDWSELPPRLRPLVKRCLAKDVRKRYRDIGDVRLDLDAGPSVEERGPAARSSRWPIAAAALVAFGIGLTVSSLRSSAPAPSSVVRSQILPPEGEEIAGPTVELSPDGELLVFAEHRAPERRRLWLRRLDERAAEPLEGTEGADFPFWSPDSRSIGFFADDALKVVSARGGAPRTVTDAPEGRGGTWNEDGVILFGSDPGGVFYRVEASGGERVPVTERGDERDHRHPFFLPDGRHYFFFTWQPTGIFLGDLRTGETEPLIPGAFDGKYVGTGWMTYADDAAHALFAQRFDADTLALVGEPVSVATEVQTSGPYGASYTFSHSNLLAYQPRERGASRSWLDRSGRSVGEIHAAAGLGWTHRISPSGRLLAIGGNNGLNILDLERDVSQRIPLASVEEQALIYPAWSPDESRIAYVQSGSVHVAALDGSPVARFESLEDAQWPEWSPDGTMILVSAIHPANSRRELRLLDIENGTAEPWLRGNADFQEARFSPDGRWVAYRSNETGDSEIYVRPFPGPASPVRVSTAGGAAPEWRGDGRELFYSTLEGSLMAVAVEDVASMKLSVPTELADALPYPSLSMRYQPTPDGQRFLITRFERRPLELVQGWLQTLGN